MTQEKLALANRLSARIAALTYAIMENKKGKLLPLSDVEDNTFGANEIFKKINDQVREYQLSLMSDTLKDLKVELNAL